jgi:hypothetical protein
MFWFPVYEHANGSYCIDKIINSVFCGNLNPGKLTSELPLILLVSLHIMWGSYRNTQCPIQWESWTTESYMNVQTTQWLCTEERPCPGAAAKYPPVVVHDLNSHGVCWVMATRFPEVYDLVHEIKLNLTLNFQNEQERTRSEITLDKI